MNKQEKEEMRDGFDLCLAKIEHQKKVISTLIAWLTVELGFKNAENLLNELHKKYRKTKPVKIKKTTNIN